jgi:hypothetical protein
MKGEMKAQRERRLYEDDYCPCCGQLLEIPGRIMFWEEELLAVRANVLVYLGRPDFAILRTLFDAWPRRVPADFIYESVWGNEEMNEDTIHVTICKLRKKIAPLGLLIPHSLKNAASYALQIQKWESDPVPKRGHAPLRIVS